MAKPHPFIKSVRSSNHATTEVKKVDPVDIELVDCIQDGGRFYSDHPADIQECESFIADYSHMVRGDNDMAGARAARRRFAEEYPQFVRIAVNDAFAAKAEA